MKKTIRITESELTNIINSIINEQSVIGAPNFGTITMPSKTQNKKNIKKSKPVDTVIQGLEGDPYQYKEYKGTYFYAKKGSNPSWIQVKNPKGVNSIKKLFSNKTTTNKTTTTNNVTTNKSVDTSWINKASQQVRNQVKYLQSKKFVKPFTILDDINSKVYAVNSDYSLYNVYNVVTGKDRGDEVKDVTFTDWFFENPMDNLWKGIKTWWEKDLQSAANELDNAYFNTKMWVKKNTPSGIFKADLGVGNWLKDKALTAFAEKDYGKKFIGFETLGGEELAVGFHGTKNPARINLTKDDWNKNVKNKRGNVSFGCVNFKDVDIQNLSKFMSSGQYSFWLPDSTTNILKF